MEWTLHFGNVNYRHMPLPRLIFQRRQLSGCRNQLTVPLLETRLCVHRGAGFLEKFFDFQTPGFSKNDPRRRTLHL